MSEYAANIVGHRDLKRTGTSLEPSCHRRCAVEFMALEVKYC